MLFLVSKFHLSVEYPCNVRFCCAIILTERIAKYQSECDAILEYQKTRCYFGPRLLFPVLSLPFGVRPLPCKSAPKLYEMFPKNISRYHISSPVLTIECQCHQNIITFQIISESLQIILDHLFQSFPKDYISQIPVLAIGYENTGFYQSHVVIFC